MDIETVEDVPEDANEETTESVEDRVFRLEKFADAIAAREGMSVDGLISHAVQVGNVNE